MLGRRSRSRKGLRSSEEPGGKEDDGDEGSAKSDEDVGREGRGIGRCIVGRSRSSLMLNLRY